MPNIRVKENEPFEVAIRRFKRTVEKTGLLTELRAASFTKAHRRAQAQGGKRRRQAPAQSLHQSDPAAENVLIPRPFSEPRKPPATQPRGTFHFHTSRKPNEPQDTHYRRHENAMKAKESARLGAIRLLLAAIKQKVDERGELDDTAVVAVIES